MKSVNELKKTPVVETLPDGSKYVALDREFSCVFEPDTKHENFEVGMAFTIISVNRLTGEIKFKC